MKSELPLVSVAIITYNQKEYLKECIESVLMQDYENIEIVVADDGSTDGTPEMLLDYKKKFPNKMVLKLSEGNRGITENSNKALFACNGLYITILGGDDKCWSSKKISKQVKYLQEHNDIALCGSYAILIDKDSNKIGEQKDFKNKSNPVYSLCNLIESGTLVPVVSYMFRKEHIPEGGFDFRLPIASDSFFMYKIASKGNIGIIKEPLTAYRVHDSHARRLGYIEDSFVSLAMCEAIFPQCLKSIRKGRASLYYRTGKNFIISGEIILGKSFLRKSLGLDFKFMRLMAFMLYTIRQKWDF